MLKIFTNFIKGLVFLGLGMLIALPLSMIAMYLTTIFNFYIVIIFLVITGSCVIGFLNK